MLKTLRSLAQSVTSFISKLSNKEVAFLFIIIFLAAILRLYNIEGTLMFQGDQGRDASIVRNLLVNADPILIGPTASVGKIQLGPLYYYFMAPWLWAWGYSPLGPAIGVAILGIITVPVLYFTLKDMFSRRAAGISAILFTFSSVIIENTRTSWNPNPMPIVIILMLWFFYKAYKYQKYHYLVWATVCVAVALQLHYMILVASPALIVLYAMIFRDAKDKKQFLRAFLFSVFIFIIFSLPLIIFDIRHNYLNTRGFAEFFQKGHQTETSFLMSLDNMEGRMFQSIGYVLGLEPVYHIRNAASYIITIIFLILSWKNWGNKALKVLTTYFVLSIIGLGFYKASVYPHYLGFMFPVPFMMVGAITHYWLKIKNIWTKLALATLIPVFVAYNAVQYGFWHPTGWTIRDYEKVAVEIAADSEGRAYNIVLIDDTRDYRAMNYRYYAEKLETKILAPEDYARAEVLYLVTDKSLKEIYMQKIYELDSFAPFKATQSWDFEGGPSVYRLEKTRSQVYTNP